MPASPWSRGSGTGTQRQLLPCAAACRLGAFPEALLDIAIEQARAHHALSPSMQTLERSCDNAFGLYRKTRPPASSESVRRSRALDKPGPHPLLAEVAQRMGLMHTAAGDTARAAITGWLKSFRPAATVLEAQVWRLLCCCCRSACPKHLPFHASLGRLGSSYSPMERHSGRSGGTTICTSSVVRELAHAERVPVSGYWELVCARPTQHDCNSVQVAANRKGEGAGFCAVPGVRSSTGPGGVVDVMAQKRAAHATSIAAHHSAAVHRAATPSTATLASAPAADAAPADAPPAAAAAAAAAERPLGPIVPDVVGSGGTGRFRDADFFVSAERPDRHAEEGYAVGDRGRGALHANVLDLTGEDGSGTAAGGRKTVWDNKKKRYVTLQKDETMKAGRRVKVRGAVVKAGGKGGEAGEGEAGAIYKKWLKRGGKKAASGAGGSTKGGTSTMGDRCGTASGCGCCRLHACFG